MTDREGLVARIKAQVRVAQNAGAEEAFAKVAYERAQSRARQEIEAFEELLAELDEEEDGDG